jgi:hypothetical protein
MKARRRNSWIYRNLSISDLFPMSERKALGSRVQAEVLKKIQREISLRGNNAGGVSGIRYVEYEIINVPPLGASWRNTQLLCKSNRNGGGRYAKSSISGPLGAQGI